MLICCLFFPPTYHLPCAEAQCAILPPTHILSFNKNVIFPVQIVHELLNPKLYIEICEYNYMNNEESFAIGYLIGMIVAIIVFILGELI